MSIEGGVTLVESLASAIDHAAERGIHHGSLHLRDILIADEGVRITGFGIAAALAKVGAKRPTRPQYSSPDGPSDVYSLGAIAFEAVTGKRVSPDNLADFEQQHGVELRDAFGMALGANPRMRPERADDFAAELRDAAELTTEAEMNTAAVGAAVATGAPVVTIEEPVPTIEEPIPTIEKTVDAEGADDDFEFDVPLPPPISPASPLMSMPVDDPADRLTAIEPPSPFSWSAQPPRALQPDDDPVEPAGRRWPIVPVFLVFAVLAALSAGFFLRSRGPEGTDAPEKAVDETTVDLRGNAPPKPAPPAAAKKTERARCGGSVGVAAGGRTLASRIGRRRPRSNRQPAGSIDAK